MYIKKARLLFLNNDAKHMSPYIKKLGQSIGNKNKSFIGRGM
ncbi:hypothetical protein Hdeb2414_s0027g00686181 [Helianthus debilis subsp. tardiflorus]